MKWYCKTFQELSLTELHQILKLRIDVFIVEQECVYHELDGKDDKAYHLFALSESHSQIAAYARIFKPGDYFKEATFGRVVVHPNYRNKKLGYSLVERTINTIEKNFKFPIKISAQTYLKKFYESFGFEQINKEYLEDGIPHIDMLKT